MSADLCTRRTRASNDQLNSPDRPAEIERECNCMRCAGWPASTVSGCSSTPVRSVGASRTRPRWCALSCARAHSPRSGARGSCSCSSAASAERRQRQGEAPTAQRRRCCSWLMRRCRSRSDRPARLTTRWAARAAKCAGGWGWNRPWARGEAAAVVSNRWAECRETGSAYCSDST